MSYMKFAVILMNKKILIPFGGTLFTAYSEGFLFHPETGSLIISDCHFGKTTHFRKHALPIPELAIQRDFLRLKDIADHLQPGRIIFLGDLFHSGVNREWDILSEFLYTHIKATIILVMGNHDILPHKIYKEAGFELTDCYLLGEIACIHDQNEVPNQAAFTISGHIHPGYRLSGIGRQKLALPCFYVGSNHMIMPAFGSLTGLSIIEKKEKNDRVVCFTPERIFEVN